MLRTLLKDTIGATAIEYAVIASLISVAAIGAFLVLGTQSRTNLETVETAFKPST